MWRYHPQGETRAARASAVGRLWAGVVAGACLAVLVTAAALRPDASGLGTHTQLGLAACGFELATGLPCATCGMTTSFSLAADGRVLDAVATQPFGALLAVLSAVAVLVGGWSAAAGMNPLPLVAPLGRSSVIITVIAALLFAWAYKMMLAMGG